MNSEESLTNTLRPSLYERMGGEPVLSRLIKWFYAKVRYEPGVEHIFKEHVDHWPTHIRHITAFWRTMSGGPAATRSAMGRHFRLDLTHEHFAIWLKVWDQNCREILPPAEAEEMSKLAHNLGDDLQRMIARRAQQRG